MINQFWEFQRGDVFSTSVDRSVFFTLANGAEVFESSYMKCELKFSGDEHHCRRVYSAIASIFFRFFQFLATNRQHMYVFQNSHLRLNKPTYQKFVNLENKMRSRNLIELSG